VYLLFDIAFKGFPCPKKITGINCLIGLPPHSADYFSASSITKRPFINLTRIKSPGKRSLKFSYGPVYRPGRQRLCSVETCLTTGIIADDLRKIPIDDLVLYKCYRFQCKHQTETAKARASPQPVTVQEEPTDSPAELGCGKDALKDRVEQSG
jgi:hypothetical protein